jgi:hypothetical protein
VDVSTSCSATDVAWQCGVVKSVAPLNFFGGNRSTTLPPPPILRPIPSVFDAELDQGTGKGWFQVVLCLSSSQPAFLRPTPSAFNAELDQGTGKGRFQVVLSLASSRSIPSAYGASHRLRPKAVAFTTRIFQVISKGRRGHPYSAHRLLYDCQRNVFQCSIGLVP